MTSSGINNSCTTPSHAAYKFSHESLWDVVPSFNQACCKLIECCRWMLKCANMPVEVIPRVLDRIHVRRMGWPRTQLIDTRVVQEALSWTRAMSRCVVLHEDKTRSMLLHERQNMRLQNFCHIPRRCQVALNTDQWSAMVRRHRSPHHDASSPEVCGFLNAAGMESFSFPSIDTNPSIMALQEKSGFIRKDNWSPLNGIPSDMRSSPPQPRPDMMR